MQCLRQLLQELVEDALRVAVAGRALKDINYQPWTNQVSSQQHISAMPKIFAAHKRDMAEEG